MEVRDKCSFSSLVVLLNKNWSFPLQISSDNVTKPMENLSLRKTLNMPFRTNLVLAFFSHFLLLLEIKTKLSLH